MSIPADLKYTRDHEWLRLEDGELAAVGITHHAQEELSDVVFVELPEVGAQVAANDSIAVVESVKAASDIYSPLAGEVVEVNQALEDDPALLNNEPYEGGWIFKLKLSDSAEAQELMSAEAYGDFIG